MTPTPEPSQARRRMVEQLRAAGALGDERVAAAFAAEPRHLYVPSFYRQVITGGEPRQQLVDSTDPTWLDTVYSDTHLVTLLRLGDAGPPMSSSTAPSLMAAMLTALEVAKGMRVVEIGAGTGYNAGLLARLASQGKITTIEVEPAVADAAAMALKRAGHPNVTVITGDGGEPDELESGVDRLIATCAVTTVPDSWRRLVRPGGRMVVPLGTGVAVLDLDGRQAAVGRFLPTGAYFMGLRDRGDPSGFPAFPGEPDSEPVPCTMPVQAWTDENFRFAVSLALPGLVRGGGPDQTELLLWHADGSVARIHPDHTARQRGSRRLAEALAALWRDFTIADAPAREDYQVTITPTGHHTVWVPGTTLRLTGRR